MSNFEYIQSCNKEALSEILTSLVLSVFEQLGLDVNDPLIISAEKSRMLSWLNDIVMSGEYLN